MLPIEQICLGLGLLLLVSVYATKLSSKFGIPALILFLLVGMISGSEGIGGIEFDSPNIAQLVGNIALIFILFSGGLDTRWRDIRPVITEGLILATLGVLITTLVMGTFAWLMLGSFSSFQIGVRGLSWLQGLLLGGIISSTDAAAVFGVLKSSQVRLKNNLQPLLELESGSNDPMAVLLTATLVDILSSSGVSWLQLTLRLTVELMVGTVMGYGAGILMTWAINHMNIEEKGLYPVGSIALIFLTFGITTYLQGNGFLALYISGVVMGNKTFEGKELITSFHDGLSWLMQILMFLTLGLFAFPTQLFSIAPISVVIALFLIFVARPLTVLIALPSNSRNLNEKLFIAWGGLRGAVPIILSIMPLTAGIPEAKDIFNVVFFVVLLSVLIQGLSLTNMAKWLKVVDLREN